MTARVLMIQGTASSVGKSLLTAALCRLYARRGVSVAPFKAQNLSNNAAVCPDGAEIGRSTAVQAMACGLAPSADMNPVLLKPEGAGGVQTIVDGRPMGAQTAASYDERVRFLWQHATAALARLRARHELVIIEGAGSPVELNLKRGDIVNMAMARYARAPVLLVGDIDRGGIFAQMLGTLWLLEPEERELVAGVVVNRFRGDVSMFHDGASILEERGGVPVLGIVPWIDDLRLPEEDAVALDALPPRDLGAETQVDIAFVRLPLIANFDEFDALAHTPGVRLRYVERPSQLGQPDAIILPGTKGTIHDLEWLRAIGLFDEIRRLARTDTPVVGICGGYQMLGESIADPDHIESPVDRIEGLGLLPLRTRFEGTKETHQATARIRPSSGWLASVADCEITGYEIHMGRTELIGDDVAPLCTLTQRSGAPASVPDGAVSASGKVWGCYLHGILDNQRLCGAWLQSLGWRPSVATASGAPHWVAQLDRVADILEASFDMERLERIIWQR